MANSGGPTPAEGYRPRKTTDKRGGHIEPEGAQPRAAAVSRGKYPKGTVPSPEGASGRKPTGSPEENSLISDVVPPIVTRAAGTANTTQNPVGG